MHRDVFMVCALRSERYEKGKHMKFTLEIKMDESEGSELAESGIDMVIPDMLRRVANRFEAAAISGVIRDTCGNRIGSYQTTGDSK